MSAAYTSTAFDQVYIIGMNALLETKIFVIYELFLLYLSFIRQLKKYNISNFILCVCVFCLRVCMCTTNVLKTRVKVGCMRLDFHDSSRSVA